MSGRCVCVVEHVDSPYDAQGKAALFSSEKKEPADDADFPPDILPDRQSNLNSSSSFSSSRDQQTWLLADDQETKQRVNAENVEPEEFAPAAIAVPSPREEANVVAVKVEGNEAMESDPFTLQEVPNSHVGAAVRSVLHVLHDERSNSLKENRTAYPQSENSKSEGTRYALLRSILEYPTLEPPIELQPAHHSQIESQDLATQPCLSLQLASHGDVPRRCACRRCVGSVEEWPCAEQDCICASAEGAAESAADGAEGSRTESGGQTCIVLDDSPSPPASEERSNSYFQLPRKETGVRNRRERTANVDKPYARCSSQKALKSKASKRCHERIQKP